MRLLISVFLLLLQLIPVKAKCGVTNLYHLTISDTLIKYGSTSAAAPDWKYIGGGTNLDTVS